MLVASDRRAVEMYRRQDQEQALEPLPWAMRAYSPGEAIVLASVNIQIPLDEIYVDTAIA